MNKQGGFIMPKLDGTGPQGKGPMTGAGSGDCIIALNTPREEVKYLKNQELILKRELKQISVRIKLLEKSGEVKK